MKGTTVHTVDKWVNVGRQSVPIQTNTEISTELLGVRENPLSSSEAICVLVPYPFVKLAHLLHPMLPVLENLYTSSTQGAPRYSGTLEHSCMGITDFCFTGLNNH